MAAIRNALKRILDGTNKGTIVAMGEFEDKIGPEVVAKVGARILVKNEDEVKKMKYIIFRLKSTKGGLVTIYDSGEDVRFEDGLEVGDDIMLMVKDNWCARWEKERPEGIRKFFP